MPEVPHHGVRPGQRLYRRDVAGEEFNGVPAPCLADGRGAWLFVGEGHVGPSGYFDGGVSALVAAKAASPANPAVSIMDWTIGLGTTINDPRSLTPS